MNWIILNRRKDSYGTLYVTFSNIKTHQLIDSEFSEGEHSQVEHFLNALNEEEL